VAYHPSAESFQQQRPHDIFGVNQPHYPSLSLPHSRALYSREDFSSTTPASLHNSYGRSDYFPNNQSNNSNNPNANDASRNPNELTPQQIQQQQQFGLMNSSLASAAAAASLDNFNPGGEQAPSSGVTRSRSRSRSKVSASRSRVSKRPSLPAPPHEEGGESPDSSRAQSTSRPSAIVIPGHSGHPGHHGSHSFSSFHTSTNHPTSPVTWGYPGHVNPNGDYGEGSAGHQLFGQSFGGAGSLGPGQSPTTHNSGSPPASATMDAAAKSVLFLLVSLFLLSYPLSPLSVIAPTRFPISLVIKRVPAIPPIQDFPHPLRPPNSFLSVEKVTDWMLTCFPLDCFTPLIGLDPYR
jgi:hypothetical protein